MVLYPIWLTGWWLQQQICLKKWNSWFLNNGGPHRRFYSKKNGISPATNGIIKQRFLQGFPNLYFLRSPVVSHCAIDFWELFCMLREFFNMIVWFTQHKRIRTTVRMGFHMFWPPKFGTDRTNSTIKHWYVTMKNINRATDWIILDTKHGQPNFTKDLAFEKPT